jgi:two-component system response regulator GlrR
VIREGPLCVVQDLRSRNGVFLNGKQVAQVALSPGDVLRLGEWVGVVVPYSDAERSFNPPFQRIDPDILVGPRLLAVLEEARQVSTTDIGVVLEGETGTGKERLARAIHAWSGRGGAFVAINCAALPETLAEAELFGHRRGAFTGADRTGQGHFRAAHGGTLFLDELIELPPAVQAKLLRAIENKEVTPLGESSPVAVDVRIIAATQSPLEQTVAAGRFRRDLHARLDGITLKIPPLRERREEIAFLFTQFLQERTSASCPEVSPRLIEQLCLYNWPHNVRELDLLVSRLLATKGRSALLRRSHLPERIRTARADALRSAGAVVGGPPDASAIVAALKISGGNLTKAARSLGISRAKAYRLMKRHPPGTLP